MYPEPRLDYVIEDSGRLYRTEWFDPPWLPPLVETTQVYGVCFTTTGGIVLIEAEPDSWQLPGGGIEQNETFRQTLDREVMEEARGRIIDAEYIGCQRITETDLDGNPVQPSSRYDSRARPGVPFYQTRFWGRIELDEWDDAADALSRKVVAPKNFLATLWWGSAPTAPIILENALAVENARGSR